MRIKMPGNNSLFRFAAVGVANTAVDFIAFTILRAVFNVNYLWCQVAGYSAGILNSFIFNKIWTFESKTSAIHTSKQFVKFLGVNGLSLGASLIGLKLLSGYYNINVYIAKIIVTGIAQAINYLGYRFWVFSRPIPTKLPHFSSPELRINSQDTPIEKGSL